MRHAAFARPAGTSYRRRMSSRAAAGPLDSTVTLPGSKSITNRALIAAALTEGTSHVRNMLLAEDTRIMLEALRALGLSIAVDERNCVAEVAGCAGRLPARDAELHCGNSGTTMRFCIALVALGRGRFRLDGVERMRQRPIGGLIEPLRAQGNGVDYLGEPGYPPVEIVARGLRGGRVAIRSPESSQLVSGLLLVAPYAERDMTVDVEGDLPSRPYIEMTTKLMRAFGANVRADDGPSGVRWIVSAPKRYIATDLTVEPDASNATYFLAAPAVAGGRVTVEGLGTESIQGDARFVDVLECMGCRIDRRPDRLTVAGPSSGSRLRGIDIDLNDMPDTVQTLAVLALFAEGPTVIRNVGNLRVKETDRLAALARELTKLGAAVDETASGLTVRPPERITPATIQTYDDHRMAMSFALTGLRCPDVVIDRPECCAKTFPDFFERFWRMRKGNLRDGPGGIPGDPV
jgi:3-phosphoshikimate 1-carboxyvinyltransferase